MRWCPSARNADGAELVGVFTGDRVTWLAAPVPVDAAARDWLAAEGGETRFRFAAPCVTSRCAQWDDGCQVGQRLAARADRTPTTLPACGVRPRCRWWAEQGARACLRCPQVRTDVPADPATA